MSPSLRKTSGEAASPAGLQTKDAEQAKHERQRYDWLVLNIGGSDEYVLVIVDRRNKSDRLWYSYRTDVFH